MKIIELRAQNVMNLKAIEITANGKTVILSGKNEVGKSSVIDAITMALTGQMVERPIKEGESRAEVELNLGDYIVKRVWTAAGNRLEVTSKDGAKYPSPQTLLDKIIGKLSFDPLEFKDIEKHAQRDLLVKLVGLDFTDLDAERKRLYDNRTLQNRILSGAETRFAAALKPVEELPAEEISLAEEISKVNELEKRRENYAYALRDQGDAKKKIAECQQSINTENENSETRRGSLDAEIVRIQDATKQRIKDLEDLIAQAKKEEGIKLSEAANRSTQLNHDAAGRINVAQHNLEVYEQAFRNIIIPEEISQATIDAARIALKEIESKNIAIRKAKEYAIIKQEVSEAKEKSAELTKKIEELDLEKTSKIESAQYPVPGLSVSDDSVIFNKIPFSQASDGVKIRVSTAIAMKLNPNLKVILIKEASLLDSESLKSIIDTAKDNDYQLWIERVSDAGQIEIHIEE